MSADHRGWLAFIPYVFLSCALLGVVAGWSVPKSFWTDDNQDVSTTVFGGILAFNGLLLAVGATAFGKIYEIISGAVIGPTLKKHGLIDEHLAYVDLNQIVLVLAAISSLSGLVTVLLPAQLWLDRAIFSGAICFSAYALIGTLSATRMMHELIWEQTHADGVVPLSVIPPEKIEN